MWILPSNDAPAAYHVRLTARRSWFDFRLREMFHYRELMRVLAVRDVKLRYRQTALGIAGVLAAPFLTAGIMTFVFTQVANIEIDGRPYFAFSYGGFLAWSVFATLVGRSSSVLLSNTQLVDKTYVPRLLLPISGLLVALVDLAIGSILMLVVMVTFGIAPGWPILLLPVWVLGIATIGLGIGTALGAAAVHYRDVGLATSIGLQSMLYLTPVAYPASEVPERFQALYSINPLATLVEGFRWSLIDTPPPSAARSVASLVACVFAFVAGCAVFARLERGFADVI